MLREENMIMEEKKKLFRPSRSSMNFLDGLAKIFSFSTSKTRREILKREKKKINLNKRIAFQY